jgi:threonine/homoserine/homoserine lactone efflux protein
MWEITLILVGSFTLALSGALMPGPLFTLTISESARRGFKAGPLLMLGHSLLELVLVVAIILGLGSYLTLSPVLGTIALAGGCLLVYFGIDMVRTAGNLSLSSSMTEEGSSGNRNPVLMGILTSLSNPYWTFWWATIGLGYLVAAMKFGYLGVAVFFLGHIAADFAWYSLVSFGVSRGKSLLSDRSYRLLIRACGLFLLCFGGCVLYSAKQYLL